ncbi:hypothetical protein KJ969_02655 [Patescibacteria group bacterium]|nr:hypothetical protein [Patescibacteria group bacterium]MBU1922362.1 hypothetical protein [Patescibacteria group bacterium]
MQTLGKADGKRQAHKKITKSWFIEFLRRVGMFGAIMSAVMIAIFSFWPLTVVWFLGWGVSYIIASLWWKIDGFIWLLGYAFVSTFLVTMTIYLWPNFLPQRIRRHL